MQINNYQKSSILFIAICFLLVAGGCWKNKAKESHTVVQDSAVYTNINYSEFIIDSSYLVRTLNHDSTLDSFKAQIVEFYQRRNFQFAWFTENKLSSQAFTFLTRLKSYALDEDDSTFIYSHFLPVTDSTLFYLDSSGTDLERKAKIEVLLTTAFFKYAKQEYYGLDHDIPDLEWYIPRRKKNYSKLLNALITSDEEYAVYEPLNPYYLPLKEALKQYRYIEKNGGLPLIEKPAKKLIVGEEDSSLTSLKSYLYLTNDLRETDTTFLITDSLIQAIKSFQQRVGLPINGQLDRATLEEMNIPVKDRIRQIMINLERLRWIPEDEPDNYLMVNIPEFRLHVFEDKKYQWSMNVVVGREATATSIFSDEMKYVVFSPYWNVPQSIIINELLPPLKKNSGYLAKKNMELLRNGVVIDPATVKWKSYTTKVPYTIREKPGKNNSLGLVKFLFPNQYNIYMHDTPAKSLFEKDQRAFSHGCIRLSEPRKLAAYVLRNDSTFTEAKIDSLMNSGAEKWVTIKPSLPVYIVYFTAWVNHKGQLNFRKDIYGGDAKLSKEVFGQ